MNLNEMKSHHGKKMGKPLAEVYVAIYQEVSQLHLRWDEYLTLYGSGNDNLDVMNETAPTFFGMIQNGLQENIILHISRLMDEPNKGPHENLSIRLFPEVIENATLKEKVNNLICVAQKAFAPCKRWRDKWHAHRDRQFALDQNEEPLPAIVRQNLDELINFLTSILDEIESHYYNTRTSLMHISDMKGAEAVLEILKTHIKTRQETLKAKRARYEYAKQSD